MEAVEEVLPSKSSKPKAPRRFSFANKVQPFVGSEQTPLELATEVGAHEQTLSSEQRSSKFGGKFGKKKRLKSAPPERRPEPTTKEDPVPKVSPGVSLTSIADSGCSLGDHESPSRCTPRDTTKPSQILEQGLISEKMEEVQEYATKMMSKLSEAHSEWSRMEEELHQLRMENEQLHLDQVELKVRYKQSQEENRGLQKKALEAMATVQCLEEENGKWRSELNSMRLGHSNLTKDVTEIYKGLSATVHDYYNISPNEVRGRLDKLSKSLQDLVEREQEMKSSFDTSLKENESSVSLVPMLSPVSVPSGQNWTETIPLDSTPGLKNGCIATSSGYLRPDDEVGEDPPIDTIQDTVWLSDTTPPPRSSQNTPKEKQNTSNL